MRMIRVLADELGIEAKPATGGQVGTNLGQFLGTGDDLFLKVVVLNSGGIH